MELKLILANCMYRLGIVFLTALLGARKQDVDLAQMLHLVATDQSL